MIIFIPGLDITNPLNNRKGWRVVYYRGLKQKNTVGLFLLSLGPPPPLPAAVTMTRVYGPRGKPYDSDATPAALKHVRDALAAWMGTDDGRKGRVDWRYADDEKGPEAGVRIQIERAGAT